MTVYAVTGGKGGTGKTVLAVNMALTMSSITGKPVLLVDVDVDNPCAHQLLGAETRVVREVRSFKPVVDEEACTRCGSCVEHCPAHALILMPDSAPKLIETLCEGCALCMHVCPSGAVGRGGRVTGWIREAEVDGIHLVVGELRPGDRKYHTVMEETVRYSEGLWKRYRVVVVDTPPGTGKGIRMVLERSDLVVAVTEPTRLGLLDLDRLNRLVEGLGKPEVVVINKYGLPGGIHRELEAYLRERGLRWFRVRYDRRLVEAYVSGRPVVFYDPEAPSSRDVTALSKALLGEASPA